MLFNFFQLYHSDDGNQSENLNEAKKWPTRGLQIQPNAPKKFSKKDWCGLEASLSKNEEKKVEQLDGDSSRTSSPNSEKVFFKI